MKTKIIYISGNEVHSIQDIQDAFNEVRNALTLPSDTVLFGVTVGDENADAIQIQVAEPVPENITAELPADEPVIKKKTRRAVKSAVIETTDNADADIKSEPIVPILSILSGKSESDTPSEPVITIEKVTITETVTDEIITVTNSVTDDAPDVAEEKTLEKLFEQIAPLREDIEPDHTTIPETDFLEPADDTDDTDATLAKLASEFAVAQDNIVTTPKSENTGKIGKLKNILPFKKAKREDAGLMGDLFGWAGIAANDDEFSIPGFFTTAQKK